MFTTKKNNLAVAQKLKEITVSCGTQYRVHDSLPPILVLSQYELSPHQCTMCHYAEHNLT